MQKKKTNVYFCIAFGNRKKCVQLFRTISPHVVSSNDSQFSVGILTTYITREGLSVKIWKVGLLISILVQYMLLRT